MAVSGRNVQNKRDSSGVLTGEPGTVYDVNIKYNAPEGKRPALPSKRKRRSMKRKCTACGGEYCDNKLFIAKPDGSPQRRDRMSANFGQLIRHLEMPLERINAYLPFASYFAVSIDKLKIVYPLIA